MTIDFRVAEAAGKLLMDVAFKAACEKVEEKCTAEWRDSKAGEHSTREAAYQRLHALIDMLRALRKFYEDGEAEKLKAARAEKASKLDL